MLTVGHAWRLDHELAIGRGTSCLIRADSVPISGSTGLESVACDRCGGVGLTEGTDNPKPGNSRRVG